MSSVSSPVTDLRRAPLLIINYGVSRSVAGKPKKGKRIETKNGKLRIRGVWDSDELHTRIRKMIATREPGWPSLIGYAPAEEKEPLTRPQREALEWIATETSNGASVVMPRDLPHWVKNQVQVCDILTRKGYLTKTMAGDKRAYRLIKTP